MERAKGMESGDAEAAKPSTGAAYGSSGIKVERIAGVEPVNTIMEAVQTRFFARVVVDPLAIGDLWPVPLNPANREEDWVEELEEG